MTPTWSTLGLGRVGATHLYHPDGKQLGHIHWLLKEPINEDSHHGRISPGGRQQTSDHSGERGEHQHENDSLLEYHH